MAQGKALSLRALHGALWAARDRRNAVRLHQGQLAAEFDVNKYTMSRKVKELVEEGRIRRISNRRVLAGQFIVEDPDTFDAADLQRDDPFAP